MLKHPDTWDPQLQALIDHGLSGDLAQSVRSRGLTLAKLLKMSNAKLVALGLSDHVLREIKTSRPPIPDRTVHQLLYRSKRTCCICRDPSRSIIIHHIDPWEHSKSHEESNLVVLCLAHHNEAHTTREFSKELTPKQLRSSKKQWQQEVADADTRALFVTKSISLTGALWDCFNRVRIDDCLSGLHMPAGTLPAYRPSPSQESELLRRRYRWEGRPRPQQPGEYGFYEAALRVICEMRDWLDLKRIWSVREISELVQPGALMALTTCHRFRTIDKRSVAVGPGQTQLGYHRAAGIQLEFTLDAWEATSNSAYSRHLRGQWICTSLSIARSVRRENGLLVISATCLAVGTGFTEYAGSKPTIAAIKEA